MLKGARERDMGRNCARLQGIDDLTTPKKQFDVPLAPTTRTLCRISPLPKTASEE